MKKLLGPALLAVGFLTAGCGSANKILPGPVTVSGKTTISNIETGALILCEGGRPSAQVPAPGASAAAVSGPIRRTIQLRRLGDGTVTVSCTR